MTQQRLTWLADELRKAGLTVVEIDGWKTRSRPESTGGFHPVGVLWHHTGSVDVLNDAKDDLAYATWLAKTGRSDLPAPLCHLSISREGVVYVCAAGRANHAGKAKASGTVAAGDGNSLYVGVECQNNGTQGWDKSQYDAMVKVGVVLGRNIPCSSNAQRGHKETSVTGKWDPGALDMDRFRADIAAANKPAPTPKPAAKPLPAPKGVPAKWAKFLHATNPAVSDSIDAAKIAVAKGLTAVDVNHHVTKDGVVVCTHWADPLRHGWKWDGATPVAWRKLPVTVQVKDLTLEQVGHLITTVGAHVYRIPTFRDQARAFVKAGLRMEFEAKNSPGFLDPELWTRLERFAHSIGLDWQVKAESWVNVPGKAVGIFKAVKQGSDVPTILLPRGTRRIPRSAWRFVDYVRGPVIWTGPTPKV